MNYNRNLILLTGMFTNSSAYSSMRTAIEERFGGIQIYSPTYPSHASNKGRPHYKLKTISIYDIATELICKIKSDGREVVIIGHSAGAIIAFLAAARTDLVKFVIGLNPPPIDGVPRLSFRAALNYLPIIGMPGYEHKPIRRRFDWQTKLAICHNLPLDVQKRILENACWDSGKMLKEIKDGIEIGHFSCPGNILFSGKDMLIPPSISEKIATKLGLSAEEFPNLPHHALDDAGVINRVCNIIREHVFEAVPA